MASIGKLLNAADEKTLRAGAMKHFSMGRNDPRLEAIVEIWREQQPSWQPTSRKR